MLIRIVRMAFKPEKTPEFLNLFNQTKDQIRQVEGCLHLELLKDYQKDSVYFTYSHWINDIALEKYRESDLFHSVWKKTKVLFSEKPLAFSLLKEHNV